MRHADLSALHRGGLPGALREHARVRAGSPAATFLDFSEDPAGTAHTRSFAEIDRAAGAVAEGLRELSAPGDRVAVVCPHTSEYLLAFLGCVYAGRIAVPLPGTETYGAHERVVSVLRDCSPALVLATRGSATQIEDLLTTAGLGGVRVVAVEQLAESGRGPCPVEPYNPATVAYLQYTSGSTSAPRGVRVTHGNLVANVAQIVAVTDYLRPDVATVGWIPFFHDMGLVLSIALPLGIGAHTVQLSPSAFVQSPFRWLKAVSDHRAVWTGGPNFAYDLCVSRIGERRKRELDLSCLLGLVNGSEAVRDDSQVSFVRAFAQCGLRTDIDGPSYGLAEATLAVTGFPMGEKPRLSHTFDRVALTEGTVVPCPEHAAGARPIVGCGMPLPGIDLRIVDPGTGIEVPPDRVGEVWVSGPNVADGYWDRPDLTATTFHARCVDRAGEPLPASYLRTGDQGFVYQDMLFLSGRYKDLIVVDGKNHDPADIEATVQEVLPDRAAAAVAAFAVDGGDTERVVVVAEHQAGGTAESGRTGTGLVSAVRAAVSRRHGVELHDLALVPVGSVPRTSSRKVRRGQCRDKYLAGTWPTAGPRRTASPTKG